MQCGESCPLIEGVERQLLNEREPIHQNVVALGSELNLLCVSHDWSHLRIVYAHNPDRDALADNAAPEVVVLLAVHCRDNRNRLVISPRKETRLRVLSFHLPHLLQYLVQQVQ